MVDINALKNAFFVKEGDPVQAAETPGAPDIDITAATAPQTEAGTKTSYFIDASNYFGDLKMEMDKLLAGGTDRFFYTSSWWLGTSMTPGMVDIAEGTFLSAWQANAALNLNGSLPPVELQTGTPPYSRVSTYLRQMASAGVDVRVLVWANPILVNFEVVQLASPSTWAININSLLSVIDLQSEPKLFNKVVLNTISHPIGAMHLKMVVCGDSTGFRAYTSGIDFVQNRNAHPTHQMGEYWHDAAIKVEGTGANGLYHFFEQLWNEEVRRSAKTFKAFGLKLKSHKDDTPLVKAKVTPPLTEGKQHVQILRTLPDMNFAFTRTVRLPKANSLIRLATGSRQKKISFAKDGIFEFRAAQRKAIYAAENYIYIEDQGFWNFELAKWISERLQAVPNLKVILINKGDPADAPSPFLPYFIDKLIAGVTDPRDRIVFAMAPYTIHSKLTIVDDKWACIGTSNCMRRSFYMDGEISVSVLDEEEPSFAKLLRKDIWGEHCGKTPGPDCDPLLPLPEAFGIWRFSWGTPPFYFPLNGIKLLRVPFPGTRPPDFPHPEIADQWDGDSRLEY